MKNQMREGHIAAFFHGIPDPGTTEYCEFHQWPDHDRVELTKHRDVVEFYVGREGWEVTYRGKKPMDKEILDDYLRRRDHSIETAVKVWLKDPNTILVYEGQHLAERHLAEQVTLISAENEAVTILMDAQTHLPLRRVFQWRDPVYKDKNTDAEEYDNYRTGGWLPDAVFHLALQERRDGAAVLRDQGELQPGVARGFLERGRGRAAHQEVAAAAQRCWPGSSADRLVYNPDERKAS